MASLTASAIDGVNITPLQVMEDERGAVLHMLTKDSGDFDEFGEIYFSETKPGVTKGWKQHTRMTQVFVVPCGEIKLVLVDLREGSVTHGCVQEVTIGRQRDYQRVRIPPLLFYAFKNTGNGIALIANCANIKHEKGECNNLPLVSDKVPYQWE